MKITKTIVGVLFACNSICADCGRIPIVPNNPSQPQIMPIIINNNNNNNSSSTNNSTNNNNLVPSTPGGGGTGGGTPNPLDMLGGLSGLIGMLGGGLPTLTTPGPSTLPSIPLPTIPNPGSITSETLTAHYSKNSYFVEPNQQAVIAWNGKEQLMILETNDQSLTGSTGMMSILPLPGKPISIEKSKPNAFEKSRKLIKEQLEADYKASGNATMLATSESRIMFDASIDAHDFLALEIVESDADKLQKLLQYLCNGFIEKRYGKDKARAVITPAVVAVVSAYKKAGFKYFILDIVVVPSHDATKVARAKTPVAYRFETNMIYYPLIVSRAGGTGNTTIELAVFSEGLLVKKSGPEASVLTVGSESKPFRTATLKSNALENIDKKLVELFGEGKDIKGRVYSFSGKLETFDQDFYLAAAP